jgi:hypothetical protein
MIRHKPSSRQPWTWLDVGVKCGSRTRWPPPSVSGGTPPKRLSAGIAPCAWARSRTRPRTSSTGFSATNPGAKAGPGDPAGVRACGHKWTTGLPHPWPVVQAALTPPRARKTCRLYRAFTVGLRGRPLLSSSHAGFRPGCAPDGHGRLLRLDRSAEIRSTSHRPGTWQVSWR